MEVNIYSTYFCVSYALIKYKLTTRNFKTKSIFERYLGDFNFVFCYLKRHYCLHTGEMFVLYNSVSRFSSSSVGRKPLNI